MLNGLLKRKSATSEMPDIDLSRACARAGKNVLLESADLSSNKDDSTTELLSAIESSFFVIDQIRDALLQASEIVLKAAESNDNATNVLLAENYDELRGTILSLIENADAPAQRLIGLDASIQTAKLGGVADYHVTPVRLDISEQGLDLPPPAEAFSDPNEVALVLEKLETALMRLSQISAFYMKDAKFLIRHMDKKHGKG